MLRKQTKLEFQNFDKKCVFYVMASWGLTVQKGPWHQTKADRNMPVRGANRHNPYSPWNTYNAPTVKASSDVIAKIPYTPIKPTPNYYFDLNPSTYVQVAKQNHQPKMEPPSTSVQSFAPAPVSNDYHPETLIKKEIETMQEDDANFKAYLEAVKRRPSLLDPREPGIDRAIKKEKGLFDAIGENFASFFTAPPKKESVEKEKPQLGYFKSAYVDIPPNPLYYNDQEIQTVESRLGTFRRPSLNIAPEIVQTKKPTLGFAPMSIDADIPPQTDAKFLMETLNQQHPEAYDYLIQTLDDLKTFRSERNQVLQAMDETAKKQDIVQAQLEALAKFVPPGAEEYLGNVQADFEKQKDRLQMYAKVNADLLVESENYNDFVVKKYEMLAAEHERVKMDRAKLAAQHNELRTIGEGFARRCFDLENELRVTQNQLDQLYTELHVMAMSEDETSQQQKILEQQTLDVGRLSHTDPSTAPEFEKSIKYRQTQKFSSDEYSPGSTPTDDSRKGQPGLKMKKPRRKPKKVVGNPYMGSI
jgi:hypothetical protein